MVTYFATVTRPPAYGLAVLGAVTVLGIVTLWLDAHDVDSSLGMVLFVHMLLASSGFAATARRGHFDPVLTAGHDRRRALFLQWTSSIAPGASAWLVLSLAGILLHNPDSPSALAGTRVVAFWIVSAVAWSAGFALPRGAGGALWIGMLLVLLLWHADLLAPGAAPSTPLGILHAAVMVVLCPFLLLGTHAAPSPPVLIAAAAASALILLTTWRWGAGLDVFLVERT